MLKKITAKPTVNIITTNHTQFLPCAAITAPAIHTPIQTKPTRAEYVGEETTAVRRKPSKDAPSNQG
jgi:hypothetical protein